MFISRSILLTTARRAIFQCGARGACGAVFCDIDILADVSWALMTNGTSLLDRLIT